MVRLHVHEMHPTHSALWAVGRRGISPLSSLNSWENRPGTPRDLSPRETTWLGIGGLLLFLAMVPARHLAFSTDSNALVITIAGVGAIAVACGALFTSRSAFCSALIPVLPVERLFGQAPLVQITRGRSDRCNVCTPSGGIVLADRKAIRQLLGAPRHGAACLRTPFGRFATALPGFIAAYGPIPDTHGSDPLPIYAATLGGSLASHPVSRLLIEFMAMPPARAVCLLAALSGALYYWFAAPVIIAALTLPLPLATLILVPAFALIATWTTRTFRQDLRHDAARIR